MLYYKKNKQTKKYNDAGYDLPSTQTVLIKSGETKVISTGVSAELRNNQFGYVTGRSSMNKKGIFVAHGTIDPQYRGEIKVILHNSTKNTYEVEKGDRIAQMIIMPFQNLEVVEGEAPKNTERGERGFGSTGR